MVDFSKMSENEVLKTLQNDFTLINDYAKNAELYDLKNVLQNFPGCFILLDDKYKTEEICKTAAKTGYDLFKYIPENKRTTAVKLALIENKPDLIELLTEKEIELELVKYVYINAPFMLEDFDDEKIQSKVNKFVKQLKKMGVKPGNDNNGEE